jgi:uncharacterized protein YgiM (DUF1202 family)
MSKFITASLYLVLMLLPLAFAEENTAKKYEVVNVKSFLNIRSGPGTIYSILRAIPHTEKNITIIESKQLAKSTWVKIKHNNEYGWVNQVYLKASVSSPIASKKTHKTEESQEKQPLWFSMTGVYSLTNITPTKGESMDTHMLFQLESEQAKVLYDAIKTPEFTDQCTGVMAKKIGEMICLHYPAPAQPEPVEKSAKKEVKLVQEEGKAKGIDDDGKVKEAQESENITDYHPEIKDMYECHFSINIMQQKIQQGILCDK